jgi:pyridoxal phosphate enzyme (YggS family)
MKQNLQHVQAMIDQYGHGNVTLVAVTKYQTLEAMNQMIALGIADVGESRVQDLLLKLPEISPERRIHFIGHLQRNKVKDIIEVVHLIHSVDSLRLAKEINRQAKRVGRVIDILIQVNIAKEEAKYGFEEEDLESVLSQVAQMENLRVQGLMMMAPLVDDPEDARCYFRKMKELFDYYANLNYNNVYMKYLSMGMTNDYKIALEEGSNMIRIGTALFR